MRVWVLTVGHGVRQHLTRHRHLLPPLRLPSLDSLGALPRLVRIEPVPRDVHPPLPPVVGAEVDKEVASEAQEQRDVEDEGEEGDDPEDAVLEADLKARVPWGYPALNKARRRGSTGVEINRRGGKFACPVTRYVPKVRSREGGNQSREEEEEADDCDDAQRQPSRFRRLPSEKQDRERVAGDGQRRQRHTDIPGLLQNTCVRRKSVNQMSEKLWEM